MITSFPPQWSGVLIVTTYLLCALWVTHAMKRRMVLGHELSRKLMHLALGTSALAFPLLFTSIWPPILIAAMTTGVLLMLRAGALGAQAATVVHGVARRSEGDLYFPISAAVLFAMVRGDLALYTVPMLALTFADPAAAFVGRRFGRNRFETADLGDEKSVEGSLAFFAVAFAAAIVPLMLWSSGTRVAVALMACTFAIIVTLLEAAAWRGLDNVFIPLGGMMLLRRLMELDAQALGTVLAITVAMIAVAVSLPPRRSSWRGVVTLLRERRSAR